MTTRAVGLTEIRIDGGTQVRAAISEAVVAEYAERMGEGVTFPPIVLFHDGSAYHLADGFHRYLASQRVGFTDITADIHAGTKQDALWFGLGANRTNGQRLTMADKRHAITLAVETWPERSGAQIADQVGCSPQYVTTIKSGMTTTCDRIVTRSGQVRSASTAARSKAREDVAVLLKQGLPVEAVCKQLRVGRDTVHEIRRSLGIGLDKGNTAVRARHEQMREMAASGHTSRQMAVALGLSEEGCRTTLRKLGISVQADTVTRGTHRHNANRIMGRIVMDAENLTEGVGLIAFGDLTREDIAGWLTSLKQSRDKLSTFIRRLMQEQQNHGEAA